MATNIVTAAFGGSKVVRTRALYQWDYGQVLQFKGLALPSTYTVHFSNVGVGGTAKTMVGNADGVDIPDEYLTTGQTVYAWVYLHAGEDDGETVYAVIIPVTQRPQPTEDEPTPVQQGVIDQAIAALNAGVEAAEDAAESIQNMDVDAETLTPGSAATVEKSVAPDGTVTLTFGIPRGDIGDDGFSPTVTVTDITGGHRVTITDEDGPHSFDVMDGAGSVQDVQVNGVSVVSGGVANVQVASSNTLGVVRVIGDYGIVINQYNVLEISGSNSIYNKQGTNTVRAITPSSQDSSVYYALAKVAGADMKNVTGETVGVYPEAQKSAISQMFNSPVPVTGSTPSITALPDIRYVCGEVTTLDITLPASGIVDVVFESGATATVLTVTPPAGVTVKWANGFDPTTLEANTTYEINVCDGLGVAASWT